MRHYIIELLKNGEINDNKVSSQWEGVLKNLGKSYPCEFVRFSLGLIFTFQKLNLCIHHHNWERALLTMANTFLYYLLSALLLAVIILLINMYINHLMTY